MYLRLFPKFSPRTCVSILLLSAGLFIAVEQAWARRAPDRDSDGVPDAQDRCPDVPGDRDNRGCPTFSDRDGDHITDDADRCPDEPGLERNMGCPEAAPPAPQPERPASAPAPAPDAWKPRVDALRQKLDAQLETASLDEARAAVRRFGDEVRHGLGIDTGGGLTYAIEPIMRVRAAGNPDLAVAIAEAWNKATGDSYSATLGLLPEADRAVLKGRDEAAKRARAAATGRPAVPVSPAVSRVEKAREAARVAREKKCKELIQPLFLRGLSVGKPISYQGQTVLLAAFDCDRDEFTIVKPGSSMYWGVKREKLPGSSLRYTATFTRDPFELCGQCRGVGSSTIEDTQTYTNDLPQGYFSGVRTTVSRTRTEEKQIVCEWCKGVGLRPK